MSRDEVIANIGTIAKSGTREFFDALTGDQAKDARLIGQFGVGFYSVVHRRRPRHAGHAPRRAARRARACAGNPTATGEYTIETVEKAAPRHRRDAAPARGRGRVPRRRCRLAGDHPQVLRPHRDPDRDAEASGTRRRRRRSRPDEDETVNQASALWARPKSEITDEQYEEFYKHVAHDFEAPLAWTHNRVEGRQEYTQLLYIPARAPFDLWDREHRHGLKLYVRRVFIMDDAEQLLPAYLRFVRGVVDSNDLPLNVSREILQEIARRRGDPRRLRASACSSCSRTSPRTRRRSTRRSGRSSARC